MTTMILLAITWDDDHLGFRHFDKITLATDIQFGLMCNSSLYLEWWQHTAYYYIWSTLLDKRAGVWKVEFKL